MEKNIIELINVVHEIDWGIPIPQYFFFTGVSAAAFLLSTLTYVFGDNRYRPIAGLSLIVAFTVLLAAPLNLIADLAQPGRFYSLLYRLHGTSPMSWGVFLLSSYPVLIGLEMLFVFRAGFARRAARTTGAVSALCRLLALGDERVNAQTEARDHRIGRILGLIGIPLALAVHGYTGYILGVVGARPMWHTSLMPLTFLISAMVSGIALMILLGALMVRNENGKIPWPLLDRLGMLLIWSIVGDLLIRLLWYTIGFFYSYDTFQDVVAFLFGAHFTQSILVEIGLGLLLPLVVMLVPQLRKIRPLFLFSALVAVAGVWLFRWDTVIGGQMIPKTGAGFYHYTAPLWGKAGIMHIVSNWAFWSFLMISFTWVMPWKTSEHEADNPAAASLATKRSL